MPSDLNTIKQINMDFGNAMGDGSAERLAAIYTTDGQLLPPNHETINGDDNIRAYWQSVIDSGISDAQLETLELEQFGDSAIEIGAYTMHSGEDQADSGKYVVFWKKVDGQWKYYRDIWNSNLSA